jgi:hypothetical protein
MTSVILLRLKLKNNLKYQRHMELQRFHILFSARYFIPLFMNKTSDRIMVFVIFVEVK